MQKKDSVVTRVSTCSFKLKKTMKYIECRLEREKSDRSSKNCELRKMGKDFTIAHKIRFQPRKPQIS